MEDNLQSDYLRYRGKCRELAEQAVRENPSLTLVRGHYWCPIWNRTDMHWWTVAPDGTIHDPSRKQFPSRGMGTYLPFTGLIPCAECGTEIREEDADIDGRHAFCSLECHGRFVGIF